MASRTTGEPGLLDLAQEFSLQEDVEVEGVGRGSTRTDVQSHGEVLDRRKVDAVDQRVDVLLIRSTHGGVGLPGGRGGGRGSAGQEVEFQAGTGSDQEGGEDQIVLLTDRDGQQAVGEVGLEIGGDRVERRDLTQGADAEPLRPRKLTGGAQVGGETGTARWVLEEADAAGSRDVGAVIQRLVDGLQLDLALLGVGDGAENRHDYSSCSGR